MESLPDPCNDRKVKSCKAPPHLPLTKKLLFPDSKNPNKPDYKVLRDHLKNEGRVTKEDLIAIVNVPLLITNP